MLCRQPLPWVQIPPSPPLKPPLDPCKIRIAGVSHFFDRLTLRAAAARTEPSVSKKPFSGFPGNKTSNSLLLPMFRGMVEEAGVQWRTFAFSFVSMVSEPAASRPVSRLCLHGALRAFTERCVRSSPARWWNRHPDTLVTPNARQQDAHEPPRKHHEQPRE